MQRLDTAGDLSSVDGPFSFPKSQKKENSPSIEKKLDP